jgi:hypothetical protein
VRASVLGPDDLLELIAGAILIPTVLAQELLQSPRRYVGREGDRLNAFAWQVRQLPVDIHGQVSARVFARESLVEPPEVLGQLGLQPQERLDIHASSSLIHWWEESFADFSLIRKIDLAL